MIRITLHKWGDLGGPLSGAKVLEKVKEEIKGNLSSRLNNATIIVVDDGVPIGTGGVERCDSFFVDIVTDADVRVLRLPRARRLLETKLMDNWELYLDIQW